MKPYHYVFRTLRYQPWLYLFNSLSMIVIMLGWQVPGLLAREFFNMLEGKAQLANTKNRP